MESICNINLDDLNTLHVLDDLTELDSSEIYLCYKPRRPGRSAPAFIINRGKFSPTFSPYTMKQGKTEQNNQRLKT